MCAITPITKEQWSEAYEGTKLVKRTGSVVSLALPHIKALGRIFASLGLFGAVDIAVQFDEIPSTWKTLQGDVALKDRWNAVLSGVELFLAPAEIVSDTLLLTGAIGEVGAIAVPSVIGAILLPLDLALLSTSIAIRSYRLGERAVLLHKSKKVDRTNASQVKQFLTNQLGDKRDVTDTPQTAKENQLYKKVGSAIFRQLAELKNRADATQEQTDAVFHNLNRRLVRKIALDVADIVVKLITMIAICVFFSPLSPFIGAGLLVGASLLKIGQLIYEHYYLDRGLASPFASSS